MASAATHLFWSDCQKLQPLKEKPLVQPGCREVEKGPTLLPWLLPVAPVPAWRAVLCAKSLGR